MKLSSAGVSHVGMKRTQNQDSFLHSPELRLFVVADGMGGHQGGETASRLAIENIEKYFKENISALKTDSDANPSILLEEAIKRANNAIQEKGAVESTLHGMGTTTTAFYFTKKGLFVGHVGDSRGYLILPKRIWQITRDHSLVQEKLRAGLITRAQMKTDRMKNVITRSVGFENELTVDIYQMEVHPGDFFVICSDGLSGMVDDFEIRDIVLACANDTEKAAQKLVECANEHGGEDNVTALVIRVDE